MTANYTIAYDADTDMLIACEPNGSDRIDLLIRQHQEALAAIGEGPADVEVHDLLTLTDDVQDGDEMIYASCGCGHLVDSTGRDFSYAVRRTS